MQVPGQKPNWISSLTSTQVVALIDDLGQFEEMFDMEYAAWEAIGVQLGETALFAYQTCLAATVALSQSQFKRTRQVAAEVAAPLFRAAVALGEDKEPPIDLLADL